MTRATRFETLPRGGYKGLKVAFAVQIRPSNKTGAYVSTSGNVVLRREDTGKKTDNLQVARYGTKAGLNVLLDRDTLASGRLIDFLDPPLLDPIPRNTPERESSYDFLVGLDLDDKRHVLEGTFKIPPYATTGDRLKQAITGRSQYWFNGSDEVGRRVRLHFRGMGGKRTKQEENFQLQSVELYFPPGYQGLSAQWTLPTGGFWNANADAMAQALADAGAFDLQEEEDEVSEDPQSYTNSRVSLMALGRYLKDVDQQLASDVTHFCNTHMDCSHYDKLPASLEKRLQEYL